MKPSFAEFRDMARRGNTIPLYEAIPFDGRSALSCYERIESPSFSYVLEGLDAWGSKGRYTFVGWEPFLVITIRNSKVELIHEGEREVHEGVTDPLPLLRRWLGAFRLVPSPDLPLFQGGLVGYLSYEAVRRWERLPALSPSARDPLEGVFASCRQMMVFDLKEHKATAVYLAYIGQGEELSALYAKGCGEVEKTLEMLSRPAAETRRPQPFCVSAVTSNLERESFEQAVHKAKEYIHRGDIFQVVLSQRFSAAYQGHDFSLYRRLREVNPSPYLFYLNLGEVRLIGSSPETLIRSRGGRITLRPIAGTRPRGRDGEEDRVLEQELLADPKERAEHVMLVDLARNDAGRVSSPGSVRVTRFMEVERFSHVMHIVSEVEGRVREGFDRFDAFRAAFPAGTVSGAPKIRAMEIIAELEPHPRDAYAGAVGYFGFNADMDFCITIRTIVIEKDRLFVQAGAGIVYDSSPRKEYEETLHKASALLEVLQGNGKGGRHASGYR
ncbi:MAG: anthranilate synthase component I [Thermodesulfobacteriota bacterium]